MARNADAVQEKVLAEILSRNAETEYLWLHILEGTTDRETFKSRIPMKLHLGSTADHDHSLDSSEARIQMVTYEDLQPIIERITNGDRSPILSAHPILGLCGLKYDEKRANWFMDELLKNIWTDEETQATTSFFVLEEAKEGEEEQWSDACRYIT
ncbi:hypothetical protein L1887_29017 [Cichorium endivia]|nr:hypothetical protein L1887_29017 [Cichorium endivia]